jgi:chorismate synthase
MRLRYLTSGESHGPGLTMILEGIPAGLELPLNVINEELKRRQKGFGSGARMKLEQDQAMLTAGVMNGVTTGAPISVYIINRDHEHWKSRMVPSFTTPRPGHADLTGAIKYGFQDLRPALERASARETAARVAVGAVCKHLLSQFDIRIGGYVVSLGDVVANLSGLDIKERIILAELSDVRCPDKKIAAEMNGLIRETMEEGETLGGIIEVVAIGVPPGLGSYVQWDRRLDGRIGAGILSIQAMKGVEIGAAFENTRHKGSRVQDEIYLDGDRLVRKTNHAGGLEGGVTNGEPILVRAAMKPIATTLKPQRTVNLTTGTEVDTHYERSDFCPVPRAVPILESVIAFEIAAALLEKLGGDSMGEILPRFRMLKSMQLSDINVDGKEHLFWMD